jgi:Prokaryotic homologs of the JAB domain
LARGDASLYRYVANGSTDGADATGESEELLPPSLGLPPYDLHPVLPEPAPSPLFPPGANPGDTVQWPSNPATLACPPPNWIQDPDVQKAIKQAWADMLRLHFEQGFWVLWNPTMGDVTITRSGFSEKGRAKGKVHVTPPVDISPISDKDREKNGKPGSPLAGYCVIGQFHTHPNGSPLPSGGDLDSHEHIKVPTCIITGPDEPPAPF